MSISGSLVDRALRTLEFLASEASGAGITTIAAKVGLPKSGAHRLVGELMRLGYVGQDPETERYLLTTRLLSIGLSYLSSSGVADVAQPVLDQFAHESGELMRLTVVDGDQLTSVANAQGARSGMRYDPETGGHPILFCTASGQAWLATYSGDMLEALASIPEVIAIKESSFDANQTIQAVENVATLSNPIGVLTGSDTFIYEALLMGCDGALIGFAGTAVADLVAMNEAVQNGDAEAGRAIWARLAPLARYCWRPPIRDFRPRMKELLVMQGLIANAAVRRPQLGISAEERKEIQNLARKAGLI